MNWTLEVVTIPVADQDRALTFYAEGLGFNVDIDHRISDELRLLQLTPPGSGCSIHLRLGNDSMPPGSLEGLQLVVPDIHAAHAQLVERGVEAGDVQVFDSGGLRPSREGDDLDNVGFLYFSDPDGNDWSVQQVSARN